MNKIEIYIRPVTNRCLQLKGACGILTMEENILVVIDHRGHHCKGIMIYISGEV